MMSLNIRSGNVSQAIAMYNLKTVGEMITSDQIMIVIFLGLLPSKSPSLSTQFTLTSGAACLFVWLQSGADLKPVLNIE